MSLYQRKYQHLQDESVGDMNMSTAQELTDVPSNEICVLETNSYPYNNTFEHSTLEQSRNDLMTTNTFTGDYPTTGTLGIYNPNAIPITTQTTSSYVVNTHIPVTEKHYSEGMNFLIVVLRIQFAYVRACPFCYSCTMAHKLNESGFLPFIPGGTAIMRFKYRIKHNIQGSAIDDACLSACCCPCVLYQLGNELNAESYPKQCCGCC